MSGVLCVCSENVLMGECCQGSLLSAERAGRERRTGIMMYVWKLPEGTLTGPTLQTHFRKLVPINFKRQQYYLQPMTETFGHFDRTTDDNLLFQLRQVMPNRTIKGRDFYQFIPHTHEYEGGPNEFFIREINGWGNPGSLHALDHFEPQNRRRQVALLSRQWLEEDGLE